MNKALLILGTVVVLIGVTVYADRATRLKPRNSVDSAVHADAVALGTPEPEVTFESLDGKDVPLREYKGKVVLVNFWATWCEPCQIEIPWLIEMQQKYSSKGFIVLGVDVDDAKNDEALGGILLLHLDQPGDFDLARFAPRGPEIHQHHFAFVLSERHILAVQTLEGNLRLRSTQRDRVGMNRAIDGIPGLQPSGAIRVDCHADEHHHGSED